MKISVQAFEKGSVIALSGNLDSLSSPRVQPELENLLAVQPGSIALECSGLAYLSSAGLRLLVTLAKKRKSPIILVGLNDNVREVLEIAGFFIIFKTASSLNQLSFYSPAPLG